MKNGLTLLYLQDDEIIKTSFMHIFKKHFENILTTKNTHDAIKLHINNQVDVAILDLSIPNINGLNVAKEIRDYDKKIEIIILTASSEKEQLITAINTRTFAYLIKPLQINELEKALTSVIQKINTNTFIYLSPSYSFNSEEGNLFYKGANVKLSKNEKKLIAFLSENKTTHHLSNEIANAIFDTSLPSNKSCNNVIQLISRFKKKMLSLYGEEDFFIDNIYGLGYKITN